MIPIKLTMENFISHSKSEIDFSKFDVALVIGITENNIGSSNGVGKTSIFEAIRYALYNKTRFGAKERVVKDGKLKCKVEFTFMIGEDTYKIIRIFNKKSGISNVELYKLVDSNWESENCDTPMITTQKISNIVGMSHDTFVNSVCFRQNDISGFAGAKATERKGILKEVLQIGVWDKYHDVAKENEKDLIKKRAFVEQRIGEIGLIEEEKKEGEIKIKDIEENIVVLEDKISVLSKDISDLSEKIIKLELYNSNTNIDKPKLKKRLSEIIKRGREIKEIKSKLKQDFENNNDLLSKAMNDCVLLEKKLIEYAKDVLCIDSKYREKAILICKEDGEIKYSQTSLAEKKENKNNIQRELDSLSMHISQLTSLEPGKECPICLTELKDLSKVSEQRKHKKDSLEKEIKAKSIQIKELNVKINEEEKALKKANDSVVEIERTELIIAKRMAAIGDYERKNEEIKTQSVSLSEELSKLKFEKEDIDLTLSSYKEDSILGELKSQKEEKEKQTLNFRNKLMSLSSEIGGIKNKIETIDRQISEKNTLISQKNQLSVDIEVYTKLAKSFGKDGIQAIIMENITEDLKNFANNFLNVISSDHMSIDFVTQTKTTTGAWKEDFEILITLDGNIREFDDLSGGEQVRVAMAIRLAIGQLLMQRVGSDIRFLLLDEVDQALDAYGVEALADAIQALAKEFKILIITHNEAIKEKFNNVITVVKQSTGSVIRENY